MSPQDTKAGSSVGARSSTTILLSVSYYEILMMLSRFEALLLSDTTFALNGRREDIHYAFLKVEYRQSLMMKCITTISKSLLIK